VWHKNGTWDDLSYEHHEIVSFLVWSIKVQQPTDIYDLHFQELLKRGKNCESDPKIEKTTELVQIPTYKARHWDLVISEIINILNRDGNHAWSFSNIVTSRHSARHQPLSLGWTARCAPGFGCGWSNSFQYLRRSMGIALLQLGDS